MRGLRCGVLVSGSGSNLQSIIDATQNGTLHSKIVCVISNKQEAYGLERARKHHIPDYFVNPKEEGYDEKVLALLQKHKVDLVVLAGYLKILNNTLIDAYKGRIINIHPSLLPKFGGKGFYGIHVHEAVLTAKEIESGATVHFVDGGIDTGSILLQKKLKIEENDTPENLQKRILNQIEHKILVEAIGLLEEREASMKVLVIGNGGRESAIAHTVKRFHPEATLFVAPGNGGTAGDFSNVPIGVENIEELGAFAKKEGIDLTIVGPEVPLVMGVVDHFNQLGLKVFGPNKECSQFEGSKRFTKEFLMRHNIPTARYASFERYEVEECIAEMKNFKLPVVVKADGLAAGKGVLICESYEEAETGIREIFSGKFEGAGETIVLEEFLTGSEASLLCFVDGKTIVPMETARDYKRALDYDKGLNTGGMGGFSPNPIITESVKKAIDEQILTPIIAGFQAEKLDFKGVLFIGLMIEAGQPKVLEFNVRFGDPETQSVLPRLQTDLIEIMEACIAGRLDQVEMKWDKKQSVTLVLASKGYPETSHKGDVIHGLENLEESTYLFHAGTKKVEDTIQTDGGRVLAITRLADSLEEARVAIYEEVKKISFDGIQYRTDIAK
ncbi:phosphoribosylglycinamide formyltransferase [Sporanaerobium hydrogeniformans]|uniref:Phosphoribosylglycinamide formyltransferase n=1 Tax=Sporanaerobium hydrogeniformans TaxID=3072179 RepID=A0AC61DH94_9FIRM|nr:phosphoribosylamine--glycine ligase [Sporanaerobium hydrogeniformans]PHV72282.1 phosphoribosylglycinamide formyltransferase [Sporanaerobium hydrogeniformans]